MRKCPKCGATAPQVTFKDKLIGAVAQTLVCVDPTPTIGEGKYSRQLFKNDYRCPNCGHEWSEKKRTTRLDEVLL